MSGIKEKGFYNERKIDRKMNKICTLIDITQKETKKLMELNNIDNNNENSGASFDFILDLKRFHEINSLCLLEIYHELQLLDLLPIGVAILNLFQSFKEETHNFMKYTIMFMKSKNIFNFNEAEKKEDQMKATKQRQSQINSTGRVTISNDQMQILKEILKRHSVSNMKLATDREESNNYAALEKASFFLEQERFELEQMILNYNNSKDEIAELLNKKVNLSAINPSGVIKFLQNMLKETKYNTFQINNILEKENLEIEKRNKKDEESSTTYKVDQIKKNILEKVQQQTKKLLKMQKQKQFKGHSLLWADKEIQTVEQTISIETLKDPNSFPGATALRKQVTALGNDLKDLNSKNEFLRKQLDQQNEKVISLEKVIKENQKEKEMLNEKLHMAELKMAKKKTKIQLERKENKDLIDKLGSYVDKDTISKTLLRNKNDDIEKIKISHRNKEKELHTEINALKQENEELKEKINALKQEITRLNDLMEIYNYSSQPSKNKLDNEQNDSNNLNAQPKNIRMRLSSMAQSEKNPNKKKMNAASSENTPLKSENKFNFLNFENKETDGKAKPNETNQENYPNSARVSQIKKFEEERIPSLKIIQANETPQNKENDNQPNTQKRDESKPSLKEVIEKNEDSPQKEQKLPPNLLIQKRSSIKINTEKEKQESLNHFISAYFQDKGPEKSKLSVFFDKFSRKIKKHPNAESIFPLIDNLLDRKEAKPHEPKPSLVKQQEILMKKSQELLPRKNLKPVTIIKEVISSPIIEDPVYEEYLKWKEENKLEKMIEIIKKKAHHLESLENSEKKTSASKTLSKTIGHGFSSNYLNTQQNENTGESMNLNTDKNEEKNLISQKPRGKTSDQPYRLKNLNIKRKPGKLNKIEKSEGEFDFENLPPDSDFEKKPEEEQENFSKKKYFYKYPFKTINFKYKKDNEIKSGDITEKFFENLYFKLVKQHEKCGNNCGHLKKFYQRISFVSRYLQKEEVQMSKNIIDKVPYLNKTEDDDLYSDYF